MYKVLICQVCTSLFLTCLLSCHQERRENSTQDNVNTIKHQIIDSSRLYLPGKSLQFADSLLLTGQINTVVTYLQSLQIDTSDIDEQLYYYCLLAECNLQQDELALAKDWIEKVEDDLVKVRFDSFFENLYFRILGQLAFQQNNPDLAIRQLQKARNGMSDFCHPGHLQLAKIDHALANVYLYFTANDDSTRLYYQRVLDATNRNPKLSSFQKSALYQLCIIYAKESKLSEAKVLSQDLEAYLLSKTPVDSNDLIHLHTLKGYIANLGKSYLQTIRHQEKAVRLAEKFDTTLLPYLYLQIANGYMWLDSLEKAKHYYLLTLQSNNSDTTRLMQSYAGLGGVYEKNLQKDSAFYMSEKALSYVTGSQYTNEERQEMHRNFKGSRWYYQELDNNKAFDICLKWLWHYLPGAKKDDVLLLDESILHWHDYMDLLYGFAQTSSKKETLDEDFLHALIDKLSEIIWENVTLGSRENILPNASKFHSGFSAIVECLFALYHHSGEVTYVEKALQVMNQSKALLLQADQLLSQSVDSTKWSQYRKLAISQSKLSRLNAKKSEFQSNSQLRENLLDMAQLAGEMELDSLLQLHITFPFSIDELQTKLHLDSSCLLVYQIDYESSFSLLITPDGEIDFHRIDSIPNLFHQLDRLHNLFLRTTKQKPLDRHREFCQLSNQIYRQIIPGELELADCRKVIIIPDNELNLLPFEALLINKPADLSSIQYNRLEYFIQRFEVNRQMSLYGLFEHPLIDGNEHLLAMAFGQSVANWELPNSGKEIKRIGKIWKGDFKGLTGNRASKKVFLREAPRSDIVHLALHASGGSVSSMDQEIYFPSGKNVDTMELFELTDLNLKTKLVVLSACETAKGPLYHGEGNLSLARGFLRVGTDQVIASIWPIDDHAAQLILFDFYESLGHFQTHESLHHAKLRYLENADNSFCDPYFWAGWQLYQM